jgi:hypothetical protein
LLLLLLLLDALQLLQPSLQLLKCCLLFWVYLLVRPIILVWLHAAVVAASPQRPYI